MLKSLSIIIPAFNEEHHLAACLDSVAALNDPAEEVIVVDNNSTDSTRQIVARYPFITLISEPRQGVVFARDAGFNAASKDIIGRIDADVRLPADWATRVRNFYARPEDSVRAYTGGVLYYNLRFKRITALIQNQIVFRINRLLLGHYILFGSNMALPRKLWLSVRHEICDRTGIHEDLDLSIHLHREGFDIRYESDFITYAKMRRVRSDKADLWGNLMWWPETLRCHGNRAWPLAWVGGLLLFIGSPVLPALERVSRWFGAAPIKE